MNDRDIRFQLQDDDTLFFLHIPKTGGTSLWAVLSGQFSPEQIAHIFDDILGLALSTNIEEVRLIGGHHSLGPLSTIERYISSTLVCLTMLRDPVERTVSEYKHFARFPQSRRYTELTSGKVDLLSYVTDEQHWSDVWNRQVRMLAGNISLTRGKLHSARHRDQIGPIILEVAKQKLEQIAFFGLTSRYRQSLDLLSQTFGWPRIEKIPFKNSAAEYSHRDTVAPEIQEAILEQNQLDSELMSFAETLFEERYQRMLRETAPMSSRIGD